MLLLRLLRRVVRTGSLTVIDSKGAVHQIGEGSGGTALAIRLHDRRLEWRLFFRPHLALGEAFTDGTLTVENGDVYDFLDLLTRNLGTGKRLPQRTFRRGRPLLFLPVAHGSITRLTGKEARDQRSTGHAVASRRRGSALRALPHMRVDRGVGRR